MTVRKNQDLICPQLEIDFEEDGYMGSQLCVPQDKLDDIDFYLNFSDDLIHLSELFLPCKQEFDGNKKDSMDSIKLSSRCFDDNLVKKPRTKKQRKGMFSTSRRCVHCQAEKTPQWRIGPKGANTLCNACGLRYKLGRLVPDYRPASSPSFDCRKHSNYYKRHARASLESDELVHSVPKIL